MRKGFPEASSNGHCNLQTPAAKTKVQDHKLLGINPKKKQFEPTPAYPVNQHKHMGGA